MRGSLKPSTPEAAKLSTALYSAPERLLKVRFLCMVAFPEAGRSQLPDDLGAAASRVQGGQEG